MQNAAKLNCEREGESAGWEEVEQWALDGCPEGVSGMPEAVSRLLSTVKQSLTVRERASAAVSLLYTHGMMTEAMRNHARKKLSNL